ncbi:MAG: hypothetical protein PHF79_03960, partial [Candidatus Pacebacteria bacterium]|nr:hypothetical protein [Candidatus Paceibacterota bacterium]
RLMLVASSNDAAAALSQDLDNITFVQKMNDFAHGLGLNSFLFKNETGLDNETETEAGDLGSAHDVAYLFRYFLSNFSYLLYPTRYDHLTISSSSGQRHTVANTNAVVNQITNLIGSKTGFTDLAGGNLVFAFQSNIIGSHSNIHRLTSRVGDPIIVAIIGSTQDGRFSDALALVKAANRYLSAKFSE